MHKEAREGYEPFVRREYDILTQLKGNERIVTVFDYSDVPRSTITMEYAQGNTLDSHRDNQNITFRAVRDVLRLLKITRRERIIHRDVKPSNIIAGKDKTTLIDFGLAKWYYPNVSPVRSVAGTPHYFAPETARGELVTPTVDIYAAAVTLFRMITGEYPFMTQAELRNPQRNKIVMERIAQHDETDTNFSKLVLEQKTGFEDLANAWGKAFDHRATRREGDFLEQVLTELISR